jgi:glycerol dehydrogenase
MKMVLISPRKYVQGRGVLAETGKYTALLGGKAGVVWDDVVRKLVGKTVLDSLKAAKVAVVDIAFGGESTRAEADRIAALVKEMKAEVVIAVGGGKALDTGKAAAAKAKVACVTVPTIASNDSPTSSFTVWYDEQGNCLGFDGWAFNPDIVLVDTQVIANAPVRPFVAGMGDAMSTWVEAEAAYKSRKPALSGGVSTMAAMAIAKLCYETLLAHGVDAKRAIEHKVVTPAVEKCVEANVLLSGIGFESGGLATSHMIANALPSFAECRKFYHGEKVGFGIVSQLCLDEDATPDYALPIIDWEVAVGLPVTFEDINLKGVSREKLKQIGDICASKGSLCENHVFEVTSDSVVDAMVAADALGRERKKLAGK